MTDLPGVMPLLHKNIDLNKQQWAEMGNNVSARALDWGTPSSKRLKADICADLIILADCVYYKESLRPLMDTLKYLCGPKTIAYLSQELRDTEVQKGVWKEFLELLKKDFKVANVPYSEQHEQFRSHDIVIFKLQILCNNS